MISLLKGRRLLRHGVTLLNKKGGRLSQEQKSRFERDLRALETALIKRDRSEASLEAERVSHFIQQHFPKKFADHIRELIVALSFAILVAFLIRQFWFELYEVPTGSMRPTVKELDRMVVSKTRFGIQWPFHKEPLLFSDQLIQRNGIVVFTVEDMEVADADTRYFYVIPGKKRYIKRCVAKPGDTIYFYGGRIYAIDATAKPLMHGVDAALLDKAHLSEIEHIPYISLDGKSSLPRPYNRTLFSSVTLKQMNLAVGTLQCSVEGGIEGRFFDGQNWVVDQVNALKASREKPMSYSDLWGIGNYALARLLTKKEVERFYPQIDLELGEAEDPPLLYLELRHTPNLSFPKPQLRQDERGFLHPMITPFATVIPLKSTHLEALQQALFTARFCVEEGMAYRYHEGKRPQSRDYDLPFPGVANGCYEFYNGIASRIYLGGFSKQLSKEHPIYPKTSEKLRLLFNLGIGFNKVFEPMGAVQPYNSQRFAYFRDGDLFVMGQPIFKKTDPTLIRFVQKELEKQNRSSREEPYIAFIDHGPPLLNDGSLDVAFIQAFGLKVDPNGIIVLGDNYAMSADSRDFGVVPTENLRGAPSFTFWPPSARFGSLAQPSYPWLTLPNLIIWILALVIFGALFVWFLYRSKQRFFKS